MSVKDKHGQEITEGSYIIYTKVGTVGKVEDIKVDENGSWALIAVDELTKLWYNTEFVEVTEEQYYKDITIKEKEISIDEVKDQLSDGIGSEMKDDGIGGG